MSGQSTGETVLIIGAGIIGLACAHYLRKDGHKVIAIDKGDIAGGCSYGNCGHILQSHILPLNDLDALKTAFFSLFNRTSPFRVKPRWELSFLNWMQQFARRCHQRHSYYAASHLKPLLASSFHEYEMLMKEGAFDCGWSQSGMLYLYENESKLDAFARNNRWLSENFDVEAKRIDGDDLPAHDPALRDDLAGGFFYADDAILSPEKLGKAWADQLKADGVTMVDHCTFKSVEKTNGRISLVRTSKGDFEPDHIVLATGAMSRDIAAHFEGVLPVEPGKGYALTLAKPSCAPKGSIVLPEKNVAVTPFNDAVRLGSIMEFVGFDDTLPAARMQQLRVAAAPFFSTELPRAEKQTWFGWRPMTWDSLPIIGRFSRFENVFAATGHNMIGSMAAPATGKLIADMIAERRPHIPDAAFAPKRFCA